MKKIILALVVMFSWANVYALVGKECSNSQIIEGQELVKNVTYDLEYGENVIDMNGDLLDKFFIIKFPNLPDGYMATLESIDGINVVTGANSYEVIQGGVYTIKYYSYSCDTPLRSIEVKIPLYKLYCGETVDCDEDPWFDGTYENTASNQNGKKENKISTKLVIILVVLVLIIAFFVAFIFKRRRRLEKGL